jgi:hypothetical protein
MAIKPNERRSMNASDCFYAFDRGAFRHVAQQLIIGPAESRRGVHVIDVLVIDKRTGLADQGVDHVAKVDGFFAMAEQSRHPLDVFVAVPELQMVLMNAHLQSQADVLTAYRVRVSFHANHTIGFHRHWHRSARAATLRSQRAQHRAFLTEPFLSRGVASLDYLPHQCHVLNGAGKVTTAANSQRLVQCILQVAM